MAVAAWWNLKGRKLYRAKLADSMGVVCVLPASCQKKHRGDGWWLVFDVFFYFDLKVLRFFWGTLELIVDKFAERFFGNKKLIWILRCFLATRGTKSTWSIEKTWATDPSLQSDLKLYMINFLFIEMNVETHIFQIYFVMFCNAWNPHGEKQKPLGFLVYYALENENLT